MADPSTISGLYNWYKADAITGVANGGTVSSWVDSGSGGFTLTNVSTTLPTLTTASLLNSKPALAIFQGSTSGYLGNTSALGNQTTQTLTIVIRPTAFTSSAFIAGTTAGGLSLYLATSGKIQVVKSGNAVIMTSATVLTVNTNYVITVDFTSSGAVNLYINGTKDTNSTTTTQTLAANTGYATAIGSSNNASSEPYRGFLAEVIHYNVILGTASRATVHSYVQDKYAITVSDYVAGSVPGAPTGLTATPSAGQNVLSWTASTGSPTGYTIYRRGVQIGTTTGTTFTETGLPGGVKYDYTVIASNSNGNSDSAAVSGTTPSALKSGAPNVIFDSDFSSDIDDLYSIAVLHGLADLGEVNIVGMMVSSTNLGAAQAMNAINTFYGRPTIPIGVRSDVGGAGGYPAAIASAFPHALNTASDFYNATTLYRTLLSADTSGNLIILTVGYLNCLNALFTSAADGIDSRNGSALIAAKVTRWWCMGGVYPTGDEFNFESSGDSGASAYSLVNNWPSSVYYTGYEVGGPIYSGGTLLTVAQPDPRYTGASVYGSGGITSVGTSSSDPVTTYLAIRYSEGLYNLNNTGSNTATTAGKNTWVATPDPSGALDQGYVLERSRLPIQTALNTIMSSVPAALAPQAPTAPTYLRIAPSSTNMVLTWTDNAYNETGFSIERFDSNAWAVIGTVAANVVTYTDTSPGTQTNRQYRVRATNAKGNSGYATAAYYGSWTQANQTTPANTPFYDFFTTDNLRWSLSSGADHTAILNDFVSNQTFTIDVDAAQRGSGGSLIVYFLYTDASNWYRFRATTAATYFEKSVAGTVTQIGATGSAIPTTVGNASQHYTVAVTPSGYTATIAGTVVSTVTDTPTPTSGKTGVGGTGGATPIWSNYRTAGTAAAVTVPGAPTALTATAGNAQASLSWTAPASNGGAAITDYTVQYSSDSGSTWTSFAHTASTATTSTVTGLTNGTAYQFRVAAVNSAGTSPYSSIATATPANASGTIAPNDSNIIYSPYNWQTTSTFARTNCSGAYLKTAIKGTPTSIVATFDLTGISSTPTYTAIVDGTTVTSGNVAATVTLSIPSNGWTEHTVEFIFTNLYGGTDKWGTSPTQGVKFTGFTVAPSTVTSNTYRRRPYNILCFGDSITEGYSAPSSGVTDGRLGWAYPLGVLLGAEVGVVGYSAQGYTKTGVGSVPVFSTTYNLLSSSVSRSFTTPSEPKLVLINMGTNDNGADITTAMTTVLNGILAATTNTKIVIIQQWNGTLYKTSMQSIIAASNAPSRITYLDTTGWLATADTADNTHPWGYINIADLAPRIASNVQSLITGAVTPKRFVNVGGVARAIA